MFWELQNDYNMVSESRKTRHSLPLCASILLKFLVLAGHYMFFMMPGSIFSNLASSSPHNFSCALFPSSLVTNLESGFLKAYLIILLFVHCWAGPFLPCNIAICKVKSMRLLPYTCGMNKGSTRFFGCPRQQGLEHSHTIFHDSSRVPCQFCFSETWVDDIEGNLGAPLGHSRCKFSDSKYLHQLRLSVSM